MLDSFVQKFALHGNWIDLLYIFIVLVFLITNRGFIDTMLDVVGMVCALVFSYRFYDFFGSLLVANFSFPPGISSALGFFIAWFCAEVFFFFIFILLSAYILKSWRTHPINRILGYAACFLQANIIFLLFVSVIFALPVRGTVKKDILDSKTGPFFVNLSQNSERGIKSVFGGALSETINFVTVKPQSNETLSLGFKVPSDALTNDTTAEDLMLHLVNQERISLGFQPLKANHKLQELARDYAKEMFKNGFFAHTSLVDGSTPSERANKANIAYEVLGENLAFAPDVYIAHQGLMNSEGHRRNILSADFGKIGIGVIDAGIYGRMFVQEFSD